MNLISFLKLLNCKKVLIKTLYNFKFVANALNCRFLKGQVPISFKLLGQDPLPCKEHSHINDKEHVYDTFLKKHN